MKALMVAINILAIIVCAVSVVINLEQGDIAQGISTGVIGIIVVAFISVVITKKS